MIQQRSSSSHFHGSGVRLGIWWTLAAGSTPLQLIFLFKVVVYRLSSSAFVLHNQQTYKTAYFTIHLNEIVIIVVTLARYSPLPPNPL